MKLWHKLGIAGALIGTLGYAAMRPNRIGRFEDLIIDTIKAENTIRINNTPSSRANYSALEHELQEYDQEKVPEADLFDNNPKKQLNDMLSLGYVYATLPSLEQPDTTSTIFGKIKDSKIVENYDWGTHTTFSVILYKPLAKSYDEQAFNSGRIGFWQDGNCFINTDAIKEEAENAYKLLKENKGNSFQNKMLAKTTESLNADSEDQFIENFKIMFQDIVEHHEGRHAHTTSETDAFLTQLAYSNPFYTLYHLASIEHKQEKHGNAARKIFKLLAKQGLDKATLQQATEAEIKKAAKQAQGIL
jgi:hypothetical protein